ncbi:MAG: hypothetical protein ACE5IL_01135 [Myxococcota bacterium]
MTPVENASAPACPVVLRIRFREGERPHRFWISGWHLGPRGRRRYKILSKRLASGELEAVALEEPSGRPRRGLQHIVVPRDAPSGWLEIWARRLGEELGVALRAFDLSHVETAAEWTRAAHALGWRTRARD